MKLRALGTALLLLGGCGHAPATIHWRVEDPGALGVALREAPESPPLETLFVPGGPTVEPLRFRGNHWQVRSTSGQEVWLDETDYPVPILTSRFARRNHIHVGTAFPFENAEGETSLALQIDTRLRTRALDAWRMRREVQHIWSLYAPFAGPATRVSIILLGGEFDPADPLLSADGEVVGYRRALRALCMLKEGGAFGPLQPCRFDRRSYRMVPDGVPR